MEEMGLAALDLAPMPKDQRRLQVFRHIAAPLMAAVAGAPASHPEMDVSVESMAAALAQLMDVTVELDRRIVASLDLASEDTSARWHVAGSVADLVSSYYLSTGTILLPDSAAPMVATVQQALLEMPDFGTPDEDAEAVPEAVRTLKALAPALIAIARFSFGRNALELTREVSSRLLSLAAEIASRISGLEGEALRRSALYTAVLEVAGDFYRYSHFFEMERLMQMPPEERKAYVAEHNRKIPIEPVWELLELRLAMLEAVAGYIPAEGTTAGSG